KHFAEPQPSFNFTTVEEALSKTLQPQQEEENSKVKNAEEVEKPEEKVDLTEDISTENKENSDRIFEEEELPADITSSEKEENLPEVSALEEIKDSDEIDLREISVHYDDLPQFEPVIAEEEKPVDFPIEKMEEETETTSSKEFIEIEEEEEITTSELPDLQNIEEEKEEEKPSNPIGDLFSTFSKSRKKSLNYRLYVSLSFGLNDRLAFINNLFEGSSDDFNRVISQLNSFEKFSEAQVFIEEQVKPDYNWEDKEN